MTDYRIDAVKLVYAPQQFPNLVADAAVLSSEILVSLISQHPTSVVVAPTKYVIIEFSNGINEADLIIVDQIVAAHQGATTALTVYKINRNVMIDRNTTSLIENGTFTYNGHQFSMSKVAQFNTLVMYTRRNDVGFTLPVVRASKDNTATVSLADATAIEAFELAQETAVRAILDAGNDLKTQVNAAVDQAAVDAIVDNR